MLSKFLVKCSTLSQQISQVYYTVKRTTLLFFNSVRRWRVKPLVNCFFFFFLPPNMTMTELLQLAERKPAGVNIHLGDADEPQRGREPEPGSDRALEQQVRQLVLLLQAEHGVVEHPAVQVTRLLDLQLADVAPEPHELPGQLLVLQAHVCLGKRNRSWVTLFGPLRAPLRAEPELLNSGLNVQSN